MNRAGHSTKGGTLSKYEKLAPLRFLKSKDHYGRSNQGPMEVGARPRSILDQTIGGRSTDLFFFLIQYNRGKGRTVPYRDKLSTDPPRAGHTSSVRLSRGGNRTTGKDPADRLEGELSLFQIEWGVNRKASVLGLGAFGPLSIFFVVEKGEGV